MIEEAIKIAKRSTIRTHKTGAVIVDRYDQRIVANGWSHVPHYRLASKRSLHAEMHALARGRHLFPADGEGYTIYIATVSGKSGSVVNSAPCLDCAIALRTAGIETVIYTTHRSWKSLDLVYDTAFADLKIYRAGE